MATTSCMIVAVSILVLSSLVGREGIMQRFDGVQ